MTAMKLPKNTIDIAGKEGRTMYGVLAKNRGMWGFECWCKGSDGKELTFATKEEAQKVADEYNANRPVINNFTEYFAVKYGKEN